MDITLFDVISRVESSGNQYAFRFEPASYARIVPLLTGPVTPENHSRRQQVSGIVQRIVEANKCSNGSGQMVYATSWGLVQIMGFNLYDVCGIDVPVIEFMRDIDKQRTAFSKFCLSRNIANYSAKSLADNKASRLDFSIKYNGSIAYNDGLERALKELGFEIAPS